IWLDVCGRSDRHARHLLTTPDGPCHFLLSAVQACPRAPGETDYVRARRIADRTQSAVQRSCPDPGKKSLCTQARLHRPIEKPALTLVLTNRHPALLRRWYVDRGLPGFQLQMILDS